jgi:DegV family protein with EDD domain
VTISSKLSGSYNSAILGKDIYEEEIGEKDIYVVDSLSACCGESQIVLKLIELEEEGLPYEEIVRRITEYRDGLLTYFVLDSLETLRKNGRLSGMKALVASTLSIKPICMGDRGNIIQRGQGIGMKKALVKMTDLVAKECKDTENKRLMITHCNCYERAMVVRDLILSKAKFRDCIVVDAAGCSTMYSNDGGIVVTC